MILLLYSLPRSGSTVLFDALRCHPNIQIRQDRKIVRMLGISGRRYPRDLSNRNGASLEIENLSGKMVRIPEFNLGSKLELERYEIEKFHPEFIGFNTQKLCDNIAKIKENTKIIYTVRDPRAALTSFMEYQARTGNWYNHLNGGRLVSFMHRTYNGLLEMLRRENGYVVDYGEIKDNTIELLESLYVYLWPEWNNNKEHHIISTESSMAISRRNRAPTPFLGNKIGAVYGNPSKYNSFFRVHRNALKRCYNCYNLLLEEGGNAKV